MCPSLLYVTERPSPFSQGFVPEEYPAIGSIQHTLSQSGGRLHGVYHRQIQPHSPTNLNGSTYHKQIRVVYNYECYNSRGCVCQFRIKQNNQVQKLLDNRGSVTVVSRAHLSSNYFLTSVLSALFKGTRRISLALGI